MIVTTVSNKNPNATSPVLATIDGYPAWFPQGTSDLIPGIEVEVMITGVLHPMDKEGITKDFTRVKAFFIRQTNDVLDISVDYDGFICAGPMCTTTSYARCEDGSQVWITPGNVGVYQADHVNVGWRRFDGSTVKAEPVVPGKGWVQKVQGKVMPRLVGVDHFSQLDVYVRRDYAASVIA